jgi:hypothetical protein
MDSLVVDPHPKKSLQKWQLLVGDYKKIRKGN